MNQNMENVFYGGSFDPYQNGHDEIISFLSKNYNKVFVLISKNPYKNRSVVDIKKTYNILKEYLSKYSNVVLLDWSIYDENTMSTYRVLERITNENPFLKCKIAIGSDCLNTIEGWNNYDKLKNEYEFLIFQRENYWKTIDIKYTVINLKIGDENISSSLIKAQKRYDLVPYEIRQKISDLYESEEF